ncbi:MAG TPA: thioredoxin family protein [Smithellaceae bacterium]|nr:thioredoxin family protein [Smithellaceae bacterium]
MDDNHITQIRVKGNLVGMVGLQKTMEEMSSDYSRQTDEAIGAEMIRRLSGGNYIPASARNAYAKALVREFKKYLGQPVEEEAPAGLQVLILGPGCANCNRLETDVRDVLSEMNAPGEMVHVTDVREISKYGVMGVPALVINQKVVSVGTTPDKKEIRQWLEEATLIHAEDHGE